MKKVKKLKTSIFIIVEKSECKRRWIWCRCVQCLAAGYEDDVYLLVKLGEAALVVFIIFAVVAILYMIVSCCLAAARNQK